MPSQQPAEPYLLLPFPPHSSPQNNAGEQGLTQKAKTMMQVKETARIGFTSFLLSAAMVVASGFAIGVVAQENKSQESQPEKTVLTKKSTSGGRDPFRKYEAPPPQVKRVAGQSPIPSIQERIAQYKAQKVAAMNARMAAPKPTTALLLSEIQVIGISRSPRGYAAIVEATPIKLSYVIYPGEPFFDGQLVAIEDNRLVFRRETVFTDGHRERSVEYKPLRQPTQVNSMAAPTNQSVATANP
jgi:hypothetical protein